MHNNPALADLRAALTRAHLAASEIEREVASPRAARLVRRVMSATSEMERTLERVSLRMPSAPDRQDAEPRATRLLEPASAAAPQRVLDGLHDRLAPILALRGIRWSRPTLGSVAGVESEVAAQRLQRIDAEWVRVNCDAPQSADRIEVETFAREGATWLRLSAWGGSGSTPHAELLRRSDSGADFARELREIFGTTAAERVVESRDGCEVCLSQSQLRGAEAEASSTAVESSL